jgi:hypothetical protein
MIGVFGRWVIISEYFEFFSERADLLHEVLLLLVQRLHLTVDLLVVLLPTQVHRPGKFLALALSLGYVGDLVLAVDVKDAC